MRFSRVLLLIAAWALRSDAQESGITVRTFPTRPIIERDAGSQYLNFDFGLENSTAAPRELRRIEMSVLDAEGRLVRRQFLWASGAASPALQTVGDRTIPANGHLSLFNPFYVLPADLPVGRLRFTFIFEERGLAPVVAVTHEVAPRRWTQPVVLHLPLDGPTLVYDGHDYYSHHRRIPLGGALAKRIGISANPVRYANDFVPVGPQGELARGSLDDVRGWYAYGAAVRAPAGGTVVSAATDVPDNTLKDGALVMGTDPAPSLERGALGNHVIIRHADSLFSVLAHLQPGSVKVRPGDRVRTGEVVGAIGFSGDTGLHVHLHHMLTAAAVFDTEGLPAHFSGVRRVRLPGSRTAGPVLDHARLDTGDIVEAVRR